MQRLISVYATSDFMEYKTFGFSGKLLCVYAIESTRG